MTITGPRTLIKRGHNGQWKNTTETAMDKATDYRGTENPANLLCDFWRDAHLPEIWKTRPVIVVSFRNTLHGTCLVVPTSTDPANETDPWAVPLSIRIEETVASWAICNQPSTVAASRLSQFKGKIPRLPEADFNQVLAAITRLLPIPSVLEK